MTPALTLGLDFVLIWTMILGVGVFFYVLLDGFDLGVGILFGFAPDTAARNLVMNAIAPVWDGNETWLVLGSMGLLAAFPIAFAIIMPAVYFPIALMLLSLIFRGVAFEFRYRDSGTVAFGTTGSTTDRCWRRSCRGSCSAPSSRVSRPTGPCSPEAASTALPRSASWSASAWCSAMRCSAPAGWC